MKVHFL